MLHSDTLGRPVLFLWAPPWVLSAGTVPSLCWAYTIYRAQGHSQEWAQVSAEWPRKAALSPGAAGALCLQLQRTGSPWELYLPEVVLSPGLPDAGYQSLAPFFELGKPLWGTLCTPELPAGPGWHLTWTRIPAFAFFPLPVLFPLPGCPGNTFLSYLQVIPRGHIGFWGNRSKGFC